METIFQVYLFQQGSLPGNIQKALIRTNLTPSILQGYV